MRSRVLIKIIFGLSSVIVLWRLLQIEAFDNALLQFVTAGMVPGTKIILTPNQVYWVMGVFLCVSLVLIFLKQVTQGVRALFSAGRKKDKPAEEAVPVTAEEIAKSLDSPLPKESGEPAADAAKQQSRLAKLLLTLGFAWTQAEPHIKAAFNKMWIYFKATCRQAYRCTRAAASWLCVNAAAAWQWAKPRLQHLDKKIESSLKSNKDVEAFLHVIDEAFKHMWSKLVDARERVKRSVEKEPDQ